MELYFLRHGIAEGLASSRANADEKRALTTEGVRQVKKVAQGMKKLGLVFHGVYSSPYRRAHETANLVIQGLGLSSKPKLLETLVPDGDFKSLEALLKTIDPRSRVLFVGHQPSMGLFISKLLSGKDRISVDLQKGGLCCISISEVKRGVLGELKWFLNPQLF